MENSIDNEADFRLAASRCYDDIRAGKEGSDDDELGHLPCFRREAVSSFISFRTRLRALLSILSLLGCIVQLCAANVSIQWDPNSEPNLAGYRVYYGGASGSYASTFDAGMATQASIPNLTVGQTYYFAVTAYDANGLESIPSAEISYTVPAGNQAPVVALASPSEGDSYIAPASVTFTSNASDADGSIVKVEYFNGATKLGQATTSPYSFTWNSIPGGNYSVRAVATDNMGATASSAVVNFAVVVMQTNQAPSVSIASNGTAFVAPASIAFTANAMDSDGTVSRVEYFSGTTKLGESTVSPYSFTWSSVPAGNYSVTARATDNQGAIGTSAPINIVVTAPNQSPSVTLSSSGTSFGAPASYTLTANASDADGSIAKVEFYSGSTKIGEKAAAPFTWTLSNVSAGNYSHYAVAVDNSGASSTSNTVAIAVTGPNSPPIVSLTSPQNGATFNTPATVNFTASASDSDGTIARVEFYAGSTLLGTSTSAPYSYAWSNAPAGIYNVRCVAYDNLGASATSAIAKITVNASPIVSVAVSGTFTAGGSMTITATASDPDGSVKRVEFYAGSVLLGKDMADPYRFVWSNIPSGTHTITAVAYDNKNASTRSAPVMVGVTTNNQAPVVSSKLPTVRALGTGYEGTFEIEVQGDAGQIYDVWTSPDLTNWSLMSSVLNADGSVVVADPAGTSQTSKFYRVSLR